MNYMLFIFSVLITRQSDFEN